jgi:hypothetical protein
MMNVCSNENMRYNTCIEGTGNQHIVEKFANLRVLPMPLIYMFVVGLLMG